MNKNHSGRQLDQNRHGVDNANSRCDDGKADVEQHDQYARRTIHVCGREELLPGNAHEGAGVHEDPARPFSRAYDTSIIYESTPRGDTCT